ncbi:MAG: ROK family protein [Proteobacteria bacterium]|nr:ROK family protein [Pseudomonadota bacterium]
MENYRVGIDLGGTKIESVLLAPDGTELHRSRIPTPKQKEYSLVLNATWEQVLDTAGQIPGDHPFSVGIGIPGAMDLRTGIIHKANTTCLIGKPFRHDLEQLLGREIAMENDANCFTYIEALKGAGKGYGTLLGIIMGTGCGGGICINNTLWKGLHGMAGEWGHFAIDPLGRKCYCGNRGCVETKISGSGVEASFYEAFGRSLKMQEIVTGFRRGDPQCSRIFLQFLEDFGRVVGGLVSMFDPDAIVLGGGLSNIDELYDSGTDRIFGHAFHKGAATPILKNRLGDSAGVLGAAWL